MCIRFVVALVSFAVVGTAHAQNDDLGNLSSNPYAPNSTSNPYGAGNPYSPNSITNPYGTYGSEYSPNSVNNPYATDTPKLFDSDGNYRGKLSSNPYDPESISNPYGRYGNPYSPDSINNPYGAGNPYAADSPTNPYGTGWKIVGPRQEDEDKPYTYGDDDYGVSDSWTKPGIENSYPTFEVEDLYQPYDLGDETNVEWDTGDSTSDFESDYNWIEN